MDNRKRLDSGIGWAFGSAVGKATRRPRSLRPDQVFEHLESRCLLAVTSTQGLPVVAVEGAEFGAPSGGVVAKFTSDDSPQPLSNYSASIVWGDGHTTAIADIVNDPSLAGVFDVLGTNTYAEEGIYPVTVSIHDAPPVGVAIGRDRRERGHGCRRAANCQRNSHTTCASGGTNGRGRADLQRHGRHFHGRQPGRRRSLTSPPPSTGAMG